MGEAFDPFNDSNVFWTTRENHNQHDNPFYFSPQVEGLKESIQYHILEGPVMKKESLLQSTKDYTTNKNQTPSPRKNHGAIHVVLQEQLTTIYHGSDISSDSKVEGSIYARASSGGQFNLIIHDHAARLESLEENPSCCIRESVDKNYNPNENYCILSTTLSVNSAKKERIASYTCNKSVNPVPILVKSKILANGTCCKIGIKVRSNPKNQNIFTQISILIALPPGFCGETMNSNRPGGVWDGMKRIVAYSVESLVPGELVEIQAQFKMIETLNSNYHVVAEPKFPILVRGESMNCQFSDIELMMDDESRHTTNGPMKMFLTKSVIVNLRKL
jgi:hypothetical protein